MFDSEAVSCATVDDATKREFGALLVIGQGVLTALAPGLSGSLTREMLSKHFENADALEAKPAYRRQLRAVGIGTAAAGIAGYAMETVSEAAASADESATDDDVDDAAA